MSGEPPPNRRPMIAAVAVLIWVLVLVFGWALRPIHDSIPVEVDPASALAAVLAVNPAATPLDAPRSQDVDCNNLFESTARDAAVPLPTLPESYVYSRQPCLGPHRGARLTLAANVFVIVAGLAGWAWVARRGADNSLSGVRLPSRRARSSDVVSSDH